MNRGRDRKQQRLDSQSHYEEMEAGCDKKASEEFHRKPYQRYEVEDFLIEGQEHFWDRCNEGSRCRWTGTF